MRDAVFYKRTNLEMSDSAKYSPTSVLPSCFYAFRSCSLGLWAELSLALILVAALIGIDYLVPSADDAPGNASQIRPDSDVGIPSGYC